MIYIVLGLLLLCILWGAITYNAFISLQTEIKESYSMINTLLKKRYDLIPNLVTIAKAYASHEKDVFESIAKSRTPIEGSQGHVLSQAAMLSSTLTTFFGLVEAYPELLANQQFRKLSDALREVEEDINKSRRYYNGVAREYTSLQKQFPSMLISLLFRMTSYPFFQIKDNETTTSVTFSK